MDRYTENPAPGIQRGRTGRNGWILWVLSLAAMAMAVGLAPNASATLGLLGESPPPSPIQTPSPLPTPGAETPVLTAVEPEQSVNTAPQRVELRGRGFLPTSRAFLYPASGSSQNPHYLATRYRSSKRLIALVPAGLPPGRYTIGVDNHNGAPKALLPGGFRVLSTLDDLGSTPDRLWTDPLRAVVGREMEVGLRVVRVGGTAGLPPVAVDFYIRWEGEEDERFLGRGVLPGIGPNSAASTSPVRWTPQHRGKATLIALIDPDDQIPESNEENNRVERTIHVRLVTAQDTIPPIARELQVNGGQQIVAGRAISLTVDAVDPPPDATGPNKVLYVESRWRSKGRGGFWAPVQWTDWLDYGDQPHGWTLDEEPGLRYLQAWVADQAGNISARAATTWLNYIPGEDSLLQGEVRVYRQKVPAGRCLYVRVEPSGPDMDPDLYVWAPDGTVRYSIRGPGQVDELLISPDVDTRYQIEVEALTDATFRLTVEIRSACARSGLTAQALRGAAAEKSPRDEPAIPLDQAPDGDENAPAVDLTEYLLFLARVSKFTPEAASNPSRIFLPRIVR